MINQESNGYNPEFGPPQGAYHTVEVSDAYMDALRQIRIDIEPELIELDKKVAAHRATPEHKAYRAAKDAALAAKRLAKTA